MNAAAAGRIGVCGQRPRCGAAPVRFGGIYGNRWGFCRRRPATRGGLRVGGGFFAGGPYFGPPPFLATLRPDHLRVGLHAATGDRAPAPADRHPGQRPAARRRPADPPGAGGTANPRGEDAAPAPGCGQEAPHRGPRPARPAAGPAGRATSGRTRATGQGGPRGGSPARLRLMRGGSRARLCYTLMGPAYFLLAQALIAQGKYHDASAALVARTGSGA